MILLSKSMWKKELIVLSDWRILVRELSYKEKERNRTVYIVWEVGGFIFLRIGREKTLMEKEPQEEKIHSSVCSFMDNSSIFHSLHLSFQTSSFFTGHLRSVKKVQGHSDGNTALGAQFQLERWKINKLPNNWDNCR